MGREIYVNAGHFNGKDFRDEADTVENFVNQFGFHATADRILPLPSGVV
jgi:hypothetical protein